MVRSIARIALPLTLGALGVLAATSLIACGGSAAEQTASIPGASRAPVAQSAHGEVKFLGDALGDVALTAAQRGEIEALAADAEARHSSLRLARRDLMLVIADEVGAGTIDRTALQPKIDAVALAAQSTQPADRAALERLHAVLGPDQRVAFVDAVQSRMQQRFGRFADMHPMKQWAADLNLTDEQRDQIKAALRQGFEANRGGGHGSWAEGRGRGAKILDAFKRDQFSMDQAAPAMDVGLRASAMTDRFVGIAIRVLPILTPEQRAIAAAKIRDRANADFESIP
jgi:Spy/CpxP family protein refolding chaperone